MLLLSASNIYVLLLNCNYILFSNCIGQEIAKGPFGLQVTLPSAHLSTTHGGGFTLSLVMLNVKEESCECQVLLSLV